MAIDWKSDEVRLQSAREYMLIAYALFGVYAWEFLITIYYDIRLVTGRAKRTWASLFYVLSRYATLVALFVGLRITHAMTENVNCMGWNYALHAAAFSSVAFTSGLLYLRLCAVSGHSRPVILGMGGAYLGYWAIVIYATYQSYSEYIPSLYVCVATRLVLHQSNTIYQFAFDVACLCLMLVFLMRMHRGGSLWTLLVQQGAVYFAAITVAYLIATVFILLELNDSVSQIPQVLALITTSIGATRMHRTLDEFINHPNHTDSHHHSLTASHSVGFSRSNLSPRGGRFPHTKSSKAHDRLGLSSKPSVLGNGYVLDVDDDLGYGDERRRRTNGLSMNTVPVRFGSAELQREVELKEMDDEEDMQFTKLEELNKDERDTRRRSELERALEMDADGRGSDLGRRDEESRQGTPTWRRD